MKNSTAQIDTGSRSVGFFSYLDDSTTSSLYRNGKVRMRSDTDGSDSTMPGVNREKHEMTVHNGRNLLGDQRCTLAANGFEILTRPLASAGLDFFDHQQVVGNYYRQCTRIVEEATGARAFAFDHNVRSAQGKKSGKRIAGGQEVQGPAHIVHGDYTLTSAPQRLRDLAKPPSGNDTLRGVLAANTSLLTDEMVERSLADDGRFAIINLWRNIASEPVAVHPIALCDGQTVKPDELVVFEIHYEDRIGENYFAKYAEGHRWVYFPKMTGDEALLIKQWDSAGPVARSGGQLGDASDPDAPCTFSFHSAFKDPAAPPDAPDRWSIEVRCIVIYD